MPQTAKIIAIGNISEEAEAWLLAHECKIEESLGLKIILLSIEAGIATLDIINQWWETARNGQRDDRPPG